MFDTGSKALPHHISSLPTCKQAFYQRHIGHRHGRLLDFWNSARLSNIIAARFRMCLVSLAPASRLEQTF